MWLKAFNLCLDYLRVDQTAASLGFLTLPDFLPCTVALEGTRCARQQTGKHNFTTCVQRKFKQGKVKNKNSRKKQQQ